MCKEIYKENTSVNMFVEVNRGGVQWEIIQE